MISLARIVTSLLLFLFRYHDLVVDAFSTGAGGCNGGMAAAEEFHLDESNGREVRGGALIDGEIVVSIGGQILTVTNAIDVPIGEDLLLSVNAEDIEYKGVLVRLEAPSGVDTGGALLPGANTQVAQVCSDPIIGITHTDSATKSMSTGTIRFDEEVLNIALDITVVFENSVVSAFVYDRLLVNFRAAPVASPTTTPVAAPVAPIATTDAPTTPTPVLVPVAPVAPPVAPIASPVAPVAPPVSTGVTDSPTDLPTSAPLDVPVPAPIVVVSPVQTSPTDDPDTITPSARDITPEPTHRNRGKGKMSGGKGMMMMRMMNKKSGGMMMSEKIKSGKMGHLEDIFTFSEEYEDSLQEDSEH